MRVTYLNDKDGNPLTQLFDVVDYDVGLRMNNRSEATVKISSNEDISISDIQYMNEVIINDESDWVKEVIRGVIYGRSIEWDTIEIYIRSYEYLLQRKVTATTSSYNDTVHNIVNTLLTEINGREDTGITLDCGVTDVINVDAQKWQSIFSILENIASKGYEFIIKNKVLYVKEDIGIDRSVTGDDYFQFKIDYNDASDRNVVDAKMKGDANSIANAIFGKSTWWSTDATSISTYGRLEDIVATADGWESSLVASEVQRRKDGVTEIDLQTQLTDFFFADVGDTLDCYIDRWNGILYYDGTVKLTEKRIKYDKMKDIRVTVSTKNFILENLLSRIQNNTKRIQRLELQ